VHGHVLSGGQPVRGASVVVAGVRFVGRTVDQSPVHLVEPLSASWTTDALGHFGPIEYPSTAPPCETYLLLATTDDAIGSTRIGDDSTPFDATEFEVSGGEVVVDLLTLSATLDVHVELKAGEPLAGARICCVPCGSAWQWVSFKWCELAVSPALPHLSRLFEGRTDSAGKASLSRLPFDARPDADHVYIVEARHSCSVIQGTYVELSDQARGTVKLLGFDLRTWKIFGTVRDTRGQPIPGATLELSSGGAVVTDDGGKWDLTGRARGTGTWTITCSKAGYRPALTNFSSGTVCEYAEGQLDLTLESTDNK